jgi:site-specific DNA-cytosine methylase
LKQNLRVPTEFMMWGGCSPTLSTMQGGNQEPKILESQIVAMRGRNPDNPSDRTTGSPTEQRLEINMQGTSNCLTSVQKDNMVLIKQATKSGSIECEVGGCFDASYPESQTRRGCVQDNGNTCPTLTAQNKEIVRIEKVGQISNDGSQCGTVYSDSGISPTLIAGTHGDANSKVFTQYRIRKLTPRECGRLMGVSDEDISKMAAVNSNTQLYRQFGNSIVVDVMCAMFRNLNIEQEVK